MPDKLYIIPLLVIWLAYVSWRCYKYYKLEDEIPARFDEFESSLRREVDEYTCFTNNHPHVWGEENYQRLKQQIINSPYIDGRNLLMFFIFGDEFSLKADEDQKYIYIALGTEKFDWDSLCHEEEWRKRKVIYY